MGAFPSFPFFVFWPVFFRPLHLLYTRIFACQGLFARKAPVQAGKTRARIEYKSI
jgi:hypothetical protein